VAAEEAIDPVAGDIMAGDGLGLVVGDKSIDLVVIQLMTIATTAATLTSFW